MWVMCSIKQNIRGRYFFLSNISNYKCREGLKITKRSSSLLSSQILNKNHLHSTLISFLWDLVSLLYSNRCIFKGVIISTTTQRHVFVLKKGISEKVTNFFGETPLSTQEFSVWKSGTNSKLNFFCSCTKPLILCNMKNTVCSFIPDFKCDLN